MPKILPEDFFRQFTDNPAAELKVLPQSGSARKNFIGEENGQKYIITFNEDTEENRAFLYFSEVFSEAGLHTPHIFKVSEDGKMYIQEFAGTETLAEIISREGLSARVKELVKTALNQLFLLQQKTKGKIDFTKTFEYEAYDRFPVLHDLFYFKFMFADVLGAGYHKLRLLKEFDRIAELIGNLEPVGLMLRDFQSRNIMVNEENRVSFIDYQSAMKGPLMYDVVSFLFQAKANFPDSFRGEMLDLYYSFFPEDEQQQLKEALPALKMMRFLQVLGAYGFRGLVQGKSHFIQSIPQGLANLSELSRNWGKMQEFPELIKIISQLDSAEFRENIKNYQNIQPLIK